MALKMHLCYTSLSYATLERSDNLIIGFLKANYPLMPLIQIFGNLL